MASFLFLSFFICKGRICWTVVAGFPLSQVLRRPCLGSPVYQRIPVAKVRRFHWAKGAQSQHPNTRGRERMKAAWGTQMCRARPQKDLRLEAWGATRLPRCHSRHRKNQRRGGRRIRSLSSSVTLAGDQVPLNYQAVARAAVLEVHVQVSLWISGSHFIHAEFFCWSARCCLTWEQPVAWCWNTICIALFLVCERLSLLRCSCWCSELKAKSPRSWYSVIAACFTTVTVVHFIVSTYKYGMSLSTPNAFNEG